MSINEMCRADIALLLRQIIQGIVDSPEFVTVDMKEGEQTTVFTVSCSKADLGKVIGKKGSMALAIRTILVSLAAKNQIRAVMEIDET